MLKGKLYDDMQKNRRLTGSVLTKTAGVFLSPFRLVVLLNSGVCVCLGVSLVKFLLPRFVKLFADFVLH